MAAPATTPAAGGTPPSAPKKPPGGDVLGEILSQVLTLGSLAAVANYARVQFGGLAGIKQTVEATVDDVKFGDRHDGVARARRWGWFCTFVFAFLVILGKIYKVFDSYDWAAVGGFLAAFFVGWLYALPVMEGSRRDHADFREPLDAAIREVARLKALKRKHDPSFIQADLKDAEDEEKLRQAAYDGFIRRCGANNRSGAKLITIFHLLLIGAGVATFIAILRAHTDGRIPLVMARHYIQWIWPLSALLFGLPMVILIHLWGIGVVPLIKGEGFWIFARRAVTAGVLPGPDYNDVLKQEAADAKARGDDDVPWFAIFYYRGTRIMGMLIIKWLLASWLGWQYALTNVSTWAMGTSIFLLFVSEGLIAALSSVLEHRLKRLLVFQAISSITTFPYVHYGIAGRDATPDYTPQPDWLWTKGPLGPPYPDPTPTIVATGETIADTTEPAVTGTGNFFSALFNIGIIGWLALAAIVAGFAYVALKHIAPSISTWLKATDNKYLRWFAVPIGVGITGMLLISGLVAVLQTIPWLSTTKDEVARTMRDRGVGPSSSGTIDCPRDPRGGDRPACIRRCFVNAVPPDDMQAARANGLCFDP